MPVAASLYLNLWYKVNCILAVSNVAMKGWSVEEKFGRKRTGRGV